VNFTVKDDIEIAKFGDIEISPNAEMIVVPTEWASLEDGMMHETFRIYDMKAIRAAVNTSNSEQKSEPIWSFEKVVKDAGGSSDRVSQVKWVADESGFAFVLQADQYHHRLYLASIGSHEVIPLSAEGDDVLGFDIRDQSHYVFTVASHQTLARLQDALKAAYRVGTGDYFQEVAYPEFYSHIIQRGDLWAAIGGQPRPVIDPATGGPINLYSDGNQFMTLSPDGRMLATIQAVEDIPVAWEKRFPPPYPNSAYRLRAHHQDLSAALDGWSYVGKWVRIALSDGSVTALANGPASVRTGWWETYASPAWSDDGTSILLPGVFDAKPGLGDSRPCVSVVRIASGDTECVRPLKQNLAHGFEAGYGLINHVSFALGEDNRVILNGISYDKNIPTSTVYARSSSGIWHLEEAKSGVQGGNTLAVKVRETFKDPPALIAADTVSKKSRVILDPNPQLKNIAFGDPELYNWKDKSGRKWQGVLYKPVGYRPNVKYPLVIQNHGFNVNSYVPSGGYPTAFVAQELASAGIMVLQVQDCAGRSTPQEGPCNVEGYESAVETLSKHGLVDSSRVGIIGFSRTVYYVLEALITSKIHFKAASIADGVTFGYMDYLLSIGPSRTYTNDELAVIGSEPFGSGLAGWMKFSPEFNLDKVTAPLRVVTEHVVAGMWEPYALLEAMHKPVDLIVLNTDEHVLADPTIRLAAQGGNVDWFRFWLQGFEDPDPVKAEQYARWRELRKLQEQNQSKAPIN
jgi:dipeptidyl aminopeptidase/acylaminoacyl peptidase